jgi:hypothetical protein
LFDVMQVRTLQGDRAGVEATRRSVHGEL